MKKEVLRQKISENLNIYNKSTDNGVFYLKTGGIFLSPCNVEFCPHNCKRKCYSKLEASSRIVTATGKTGAITCKMGFTLLSSPLYSKNKYKGAILTQPFLVDNNNAKENYSNEYAAAYSLSPRVLQSKIDFVPVFKKDKIYALQKLLTILTKNIEEEIKHIDEEEIEKEIKEEKNSEINELRNKLDLEQSNTTAYQSEAMFLSCTKSGDTKGALEAVKGMISEVLLLTNSDLDIVQQRCKEITVLMSRTHANKDNVLHLFLDNVEFFRIIDSCRSVDELLQTMINYINDFISVSDITGKNINYTIATAKEYIRKNSQREISLQEISDKVYLSPSYFSRIFKQKTGEKFIDFLNRTRIEESIVYLKDLKIDLSQIAKIMGFSDQSYYTKVFKKFMGVSPNVYRKNFKLESNAHKRKAKNIEE